MQKERFVEDKLPPLRIRNHVENHGSVGAAPSVPLGQDSSSHAESSLSAGKRLRALVDGTSAAIDSVASRTIKRSRELRANPARKKL